MKPTKLYKGFVGTEDSFDLQLDLKGSGEIFTLLVSPVGDDYVVTLNDIHLCTLKHYCEIWVLEDGNISDETKQAIGNAIDNYYEKI